MSRIKWTLNQAISQLRDKLKGSNYIPLGTGEVSGFYLVTSNVGPSQPEGAGVTGVRRETPPHTVYSEQEFKLGKQSNSYRLDYIKNILNK